MLKNERGFTLIEMMIISNINQKEGYNRSIFLRYEVLPGE
ncbi:prepilin-type N-terminal cleavage/methylation domain-containing protein [Sporosarcina sp. P17b]|nr:prepilin-type N-terminal cleavage/methylation domain-containing protein [Sporosarcina sp. P17b]